MPEADPQSEFIAAALYHFAPLPDYRDWREPLLEVCTAHGLKGSLLLAEEGINGTVAGPRAGIEALLAWLRARSPFETLRHKESPATPDTFHRMKVRLKKEIVSLGVEGIDARRTGKRVSPEAWNALIARDDVRLIDTRNDYEIALGTFPGAENPDTEAFSDFPTYVREHLDPKRDRAIAMFCTGGIRCEKASAYLLDQGFEQVFQLDGGILNYLEHTPPEENLWQGDCFVFDERVSVGPDLKPAGHVLCRGCRMPLTQEDRVRPEFEEGVSCHHCAAGLTEERRASCRERHRQETLAQARGGKHVGNTLKPPKP
ncbi:MAG: rhodanese-related sulfurtransferase [Candidatus Hydrogenedens sp.]|nr:rhodanese-related sulfurtransferase [Candidatus Hydrogenedens sp.]